MKYPLSAFGLKVLIVGIIVVLAMAGIFAGAVEFYNYRENQKIEEANQNFITAVNIIYEKQKDLDVGGPTPFDTLSRYTELLQIDADKLASTYFIKDKRVAELNRMDGVSYDKRWDYIWLLKADQDILKSQKISSSAVNISKPLPLVMKKAKNGVWQIESINYSF
jgi:hypothetical protein